MHRVVLKKIRMVNWLLTLLFIKLQGKHLYIEKGLEKWI